MNIIFIVLQERIHFYKIDQKKLISGRIQMVNNSS